MTRRGVLQIAACPTRLAEAPGIDEVGLTGSGVA
jgi:hypothetical protein